MNKAKSILTVFLIFSGSVCFSQSKTDSISNCDIELLKKDFEIETSKRETEHEKKQKKGFQVLSVLLVTVGYLVFLNR